MLSTGEEIRSPQRISRSGPILAKIPCTIPYCEKLWEVRSFLKLLGISLKYKVNLPILSLEQIFDRRQYNMSKVSPYTDVINSKDTFRFPELCTSSQYSFKACTCFVIGCFAPSWKMTSLTYMNMIRKLWTRFFESVIWSRLLCA